LRYDVCRVCHIHLSLFIVNIITIMKLEVVDEK